MRKHLAALVLSLAATTPLVAQERVSPLSLVPEGAWALLKVEGPARFGRSFTGTNLAKALSSTELATMMEGVLKKLESKIGADMDEVGLDYKEFRDALFGYSGTVYLAFGMDETVDLYKSMKTKDKPPFWAMLVAGSDDGTTDLAGLNDKLMEAVEKGVGENLRDLQVDGRLFRTVENDGVGIALPTMVGGNLVMYLGLDLEKLVTLSCKVDKLRDEDYSRLLKGPGMAGYFQVPMVVGFCEKVFKSMQPYFWPDNKEMPDRFIELFKILGVKAMKGLSFNLEPQGRFVKMEMAMEIGQGEPGLLECFYNRDGAGLDLLDILPFNRGDCQVNYVDLDRLYSIVRRGVSLFGGKLNPGPEALEAAFEAKMRVRLREDLLNHLGKEVLFYQKRSDLSSAAGGRGDDGFYGGAMIPEELGRSCLGFSVRNAEVLESSLSKMIGAWGFHISRKEVEYRKLKIVTIRPFGFPLHYSINDRALLVSFGALGSESIRDVLDQIADRREGRKPAELPKECIERKALLKGELFGLSVTNLENTIRTAFDSALRDMGFSEDVELKEMKRYRKVIMDLVKKYDLRYMVSGVSIDKNTLRSSAIW